MKILKKQRMKSKSDFDSIFNNTQGRLGGFRGMILSLIPDREVVALEVPMCNGTPLWQKISLPWTLAKAHKLKIRTHRQLLDGKHVLLVGVQKRTK